jgi:hypothetical protein
MDDKTKSEVTRRKRHLLTAVSALSVSLGVTVVPAAVQGDEPNAASHQHKLDSQQIKLDSQHIKGESHQLKGESHQLKVQSHQYKESNAHMLNPQPLPPG